MIAGNTSLKYDNIKFIKGDREMFDDKAKFCKSRKRWKTTVFPFAKNMCLLAVECDDGKGGDIIFEADEGLKTLMDFRYKTCS